MEIGFVYKIYPKKEVAHEPPLFDIHRIYAYNGKEKCRMKRLKIGAGNLFISDFLKEL